MTKTQLRYQVLSREKAREVRGPKLVNKSDNNGFRSLRPLTELTHELWLITDNGHPKCRNISGPCFSEAPLSGRHLTIYVRGVCRDGWSCGQGFMSLSLGYSLRRVVDENVLLSRWRVIGFVSLCLFDLLWRVLCHSIASYDREFFRIVLNKNLVHLQSWTGDRIKIELHL